MTNLNKPIKRSVDGLLRRKLVVTLYPGGVLGLREGKTRHEYTLPLMTCYRLAIEAERAAKKAARRKR